MPYSESIIIRTHDCDIDWMVWEVLRYENTDHPARRAGL